ncbi:hypothetical protein C8R44DRAFT_977417, partial [Mycena epipterygia]
MIQTLILSANTTKPTLNFSSLPNLSFLRICVFLNSYPWVLAILSTIVPTHRILNIVLVGDRELDAVLSEQLDAQLARHPTPPALELEPAEYDRTCLCSVRKTSFAE